MFCESVLTEILSYMAFVEIQLLGHLGNEIARKLIKKILNNRFILYDYLGSKSVEEAVYIPCRDSVCWFSKGVNLKEISDEIKTYPDNVYCANVRLSNRFKMYPDAIEYVANGTDLIDLMASRTKESNYLTNILPIIMYSSGKRLEDLFRMRIIDRMCEIVALELVEIHLKFYKLDGQFVDYCNSDRMNYIEAAYFNADKVSVLKLPKFKPWIYNPVWTGKINIVKCMSEHDIEKSIDIESHGRMENKGSAVCVEYILKTYPDIAKKHGEFLTVKIKQIGSVRLFELLAEIYPIVIDDRLTHSYFGYGDFELLVYLYKRYGLVVDNDELGSMVGSVRNTRNMKGFLEIYMKKLLSEDKFKVLKFAIYTRNFDLINYMANTDKSMKWHVNNTLNSSEKKYMNERIYTTVFFGL